MFYTFQSTIKYLSSTIRFIFQIWFFIAYSNFLQSRLLDVAHHWLVNKIFLLLRRWRITSKRYTRSSSTANRSDWSVYFTRGLGRIDNGTSNISLKKHVVLNIYCKIDTRNSLDRSLRWPHNTHETVFIQRVCVLEAAVNIFKKSTTFIKLILRSYTFYIFVLWIAAVHVHLEMK